MINSERKTPCLADKSLSNIAFSDKNIRKIIHDQGSTITIESSDVITYVCQKFAVRNVRGQIPESLYQASYLIPSDFPNFLLSSFLFRQNERLLVLQKLILKFH